MAYEYQEYPKYIAAHDVVAQNEAEEKALLEGRATAETVIQTAEGYDDIRRIVPIKES